MVGSNNYLGLTTHPKVKQAAMRALEKEGTERAVRVPDSSNGTLDLHEKLEASLARFVGKESALVFTTGFLTNQGAIAPLLMRTDTVIVDRLVHAKYSPKGSASAFKARRFRHNDIESLRRNLEASADSGGILVIVDGVYSMEGDIAPLPEIVATAKEFGARIMVDDADGLGVLGESGKGPPDHFGLTDQVDLVMGTFSKSFASLGGFVAGEERVISYIKHHSRRLDLFSLHAAVQYRGRLAALEVIETEPQIRRVFCTIPVFYWKRSLP